MIYIKKNELNKIVLTLSETSRLVNPFYLFEFKNEYIQSATPIYWQVEDTTTSQNRYNLFEMNETSSGSTSGGTTSSLSLTAGQYEYRVYESVTQTLQLSGTTGRIIEEGRMVVASNETITTTKNIYR